MNYSTYNISLDIHDTSSQVSLNVKKGDTLRRICAVLTENGKPYKIADGASAAFRTKKPMDSNGNRAIVYNNATITDNKICYVLTSGNTEVAGIADCEFTLYDSNGGVITSPKFTLVIDNTVNTDGEIESVGSNELTALSAKVIEAQQAVYNANKVKNDVETALENGEFVGEQGAVFTPSVSDDGIISWTNNGGLDNPNPISIKGVKGDTPYIGDKLTWCIGNWDTGISAVGKAGETPYIGLDGCWYIGGVDTGVRAVGIDGQSPYIGADGNWIIMGGYNSGVPATGPKPTKGVDYYTEAEKEELLTEILQSIQGSSSRISYVNLISANWQGDASPYSQVVSIDGITEYSKVDLNPSVELLAVFHDKDIAFVTENEDGIVTVYCIGQKPTANYEMQVTITEVNSNG